MRLATCRTSAGEGVYVAAGDRLIPVRALAADAPADMIGVIEAGPALLERLARGIADLSSDEGVPMSAADFLPVVPNPPKILCLGLNYALHAKEGGDPLPDYPSLFIRVTTTLVGHEAPVLRPRVSTHLDYECELTIVIGRRCRDIAEAEALDCVFGYTIMNDVSVRDYQRRTTQWAAGKNFDGTAPLGPVIVTADELPPGAHGLGIRTRLNGVVMQDSDTSDMVFSVARTVSLFSQIMTLEPGDVIATGTPSGVGFARKPPVWMKAGDVVEVEVDGIGTLRNPVVDA